MNTVQWPDIKHKLETAKTERQRLEALLMGARRWRRGMPAEERWVGTAFVNYLELQIAEEREERRKVSRKR
jgi:hypothetical protein